MKFLVAQLQNGSWFRVGVYSRKPSGLVSLPMKFNGQIEGKLFRSGSNFLFNEPSAASVDVQHGSSPTYRLSRV